VTLMGASGESRVDDGNRRVDVVDTRRLGVEVSYNCGLIL
jgi:hypothetical protein